MDSSSMTLRPLAQPNRPKSFWSETQLLPQSLWCHEFGPVEGIGPLEKMQPTGPRIAKIREKTTNHDTIGCRGLPHQSSSQPDKHQLAPSKHLGNKSYCQVVWEFFLASSKCLWFFIPVSQLSFPDSLLRITPAFLTSGPSNSKSYITLRPSVF